MKKILKNVLCTTLMVSIAMTTLAGCSGNNDQSGSEPAAQSSSTPDATTPSQEPSSGGGNEEKEATKFSLAIMRQDAMPQFAETTIGQEILGQANVDIDFIDWPASAVSEKKSLAFASGDYPDAIFGAWVTSQSEIMDFVSQEFLLPIEDYFTPEVMPNFSRVIEQRPEWLSGLTTPDGHIYALPSLSEIGLTTVNDSLLINTEWLEAVDMEIPTTTDEMYEVLKAFKEAGDLNGNGKDDEIPMIMCYGEKTPDHMRGLFSLMGSFGFAGSQVAFSIVDGKAEHYAVQPAFKDVIVFLNRLYTEGLVDPEMFTITASAYNAKLNASDTVAGMAVNWSSDAPNVAAGRDLYKMIPPVRGYDDVEPVWQARQTPITFTLSFIMTDKAEDPEGILEFIDIFYDKDISIQNFYGLYDKHLKQTEPGVFEWILNAEGNSPTYEERYPDVLTNRGMWAILEEDFKWGTPPPGDDIEKERMALYGPYLDKSPYPSGLWLTSEEAEEIALISSDISEYIHQTAAKWIAGGGVEDEWDKYLQQLDNIQFQRYVEIYQGVYDRSK